MKRGLETGEEMKENTRGVGRKWCIMDMIDTSGKYHYYYNRLIFISVSMCIHVHVHVGVLRGQKVLDPLELKK